MTFRVGQKVIVVDDSGNAQVYFRKGDVFTVIGLQGEIHGSMHLIVVDCRPSPHGNRSWDRSRFRPIVSRQTDISTLTALLIPGTKIREDA